MPIGPTTCCEIPCTAVLIMENLTIVSRMIECLVLHEESNGALEIALTRDGIHTFEALILARLSNEHLSILPPLTTHL